MIHQITWTSDLFIILNVQSIYKEIKEGRICLLLINFYEVMYDIAQSMLDIAAEKTKYVLPAFSDIS